MNRAFPFVALLAACQPGLEADLDLDLDSAAALPHVHDNGPGQVAPPGVPELDSSLMVRGDGVTISAHGLPALSSVYFLYGLRGQGTNCIPQMPAGQCLDIAGRVRLMDTARTDRAGTARLHLQVPRTLPHDEITLQAVVIDPFTGGATITPAITEDILDLVPNLPPSCNIDDIDLTWPMLGVDGQDYVINNYVDLDGTGGILDFNGGNKTYDGHNGIDIDVPNFRAMDDGEVIVAAFPGEVIDVRDDQYDRNTSCSGSWNFVKVQHANGFEAWYGHLRRDSVDVAIGDTVSTGDVLGVVGSSGCSTAAHLHFELHDCDGRVIEPFSDGLWRSAPVYATPPDIMDIAIRVGGIDTTDMVKDPDPNPDLVQPDAQLGFGVSLAGGQAGDTFQVRLTRPDGTTFDTWTNTIGQTYRHHYWRYNRDLDGSVGTWRVSGIVNGVTRWTDSFVTTSRAPRRHQRSYTDNDQHVWWNVDEVDYQGVFNAEVAQGFRPAWVDASTLPDGVVYNAIFVPENGVGWAAWHGVDAATHQDNWNTWTQSGLRVVHVDGARVPGGGMRYVGIATTETGPGFAAQHGVDATTHQTTFDDLVNNVGMRASHIAVADDGGLSFTTLYDTTNVGSWTALAELDTAAYQAEFDAQVQAGRWLSYLDVDVHGGSTKFSAIWDSRPTFGAAARHGINSPELWSDIRRWRGYGLDIEPLSSYGSSRWPAYGVSAARR